MKMAGIRERIFRLYASFNIPWRKYIIMYAIPIILSTVLLAFYLSISFPFFSKFPFNIVLYLIPAFGVLVVILFPLLRGERRKIDICIFS